MSLGRRNGPFRQFDHAHVLFDDRAHVAVLIDQFQGKGSIPIALVQKCAVVDEQLLLRFKLRIVMVADDVGHLSVVALSLQMQQVVEPLIPFRIGRVLLDW